MRIAVSGSHCCGKSSLIEAFLATHQFIHEPEAYEVLQELHGELFGAEPTADDFYRQLEYHLERLGQYDRSDQVIFERCPADYAAYLDALVELGREGANRQLALRALQNFAEAIDSFEIILFIPANESAPDDEDPPLRNAVDASLRSILLDDDFGLVTGSSCQVIVAEGSTEERLLILERVIEGKE